MRNATFPDKAAFYSGFFNTSIAFERIMKLIVVANHMLQNSFNSPTKNILKTYDHDLVSLYESSVSAAVSAGVEGVNMPTLGSIENQILEFLSEFAKSARYYNLDSLATTPSISKDPLAEWEIILKRVLSQDVPKAKMQTLLAQAQQMHDLVAGNVMAIQHGMDGKLLSLPEVFSIPVIHQLATSHVMVRVFNLLTPLLETISELGDQTFYGSPQSAGPQAPLFKEFFVHFGGSPAEIRRKKRWP